MSYLTGKLCQAGIDANTPITVIQQALQIDSGKALETAINICMTGIGLAVKWQIGDSVGHKTLTQEQLRAIAMFLDHEDVKRAIFRLKQIRHEGC